jgi:hypothetical protein
MTPAENAQASASNTAVAATMASNHTLILVLLYVEEAAVLFCFFPLLGSSTEKGITCAKRLAAMQCTPFLVSSFLQIKYVGQLLGFVFSLSLSLSLTHTHTCTLNVLPEVIFHISKHVLSFIERERKKCLY